MQKIVMVVGLVLLMQACEPILAQTETVSDPGILQRVVDRYRAGMDRAKAVGGTVLGFAGAYYEDHLKPIADPYINWASSLSSSFIDRVKQFRSD